jgi:hypothetical protein
MPAIQTKPNTGRDPAREDSIALSIGKAISTVEAGAINLGTNRIDRFRLRHPVLYGFIAFVLGGGLVSIFTMTTYTNWAYEGIDLTTAVYQVVLGGLSGGIAAAILAFAYAATVGRTREGIRS